MSSTGRQRMPVLKAGAVEIWTKPLGDGSTVVGPFNCGDAETKISGDWRSLTGGAPARIHDLWGRTDIPAGDNFSFTVPKHGVVLLGVNR